MTVIIPQQQHTLKEEVPPAYSPSTVEEDNGTAGVLLLQDAKTQVLLEYNAADAAPPVYTPAVITDLSSPISPDLPAPTFSSSTPSSQSNHKSLIIAPGRISPLAFKYTPVLLKDFGITESVWNDQLLAPLRAATALQRSQKAFVAAAGVGLAVVTHGPIVPAIVGYVVWRKETLKNLHNGLLGQTSQGDMEKEGMGKKGEKKEPQTVADVLASFNAQLVPGGVHVSLLLPEQKGRKKKGCCTVQGTCNGMDNTESREGSKYCKCYRKGGWGCKSTRGRGCRGRMESCKERRERKSVRILIEGVGGDRSSVEKEQGEV